MILNRLAEVRRRRSIAAAELAKLAGVNRQAIYAIEAGTYLPNTTVALRLARALDVRVEELFQLPEEPPQAPRPLTVRALPGSSKPQSGQAVQLCRVDRQLVAAPASAIPWYLPASDAVVQEASAKSLRVHAFEGQEEFAGRLLIAGCDPGISVLARHARSAGVELVLAHRNSSQALDLLKRGAIHIAGTHLRDESNGESNLAEIRKRFAKSAVAVISFAVWEEGLVFAPGNPKRIRAISDLARTNVTMVNREKGAGTRRLLEAQLAGAGVDSRRVRGFENTAPGHLAAAWQVHSGAVDCCIATRAAARVFGLGFEPLLTERYDLVVRRRHVELPAVQTLFDVLARSSFRRQLEGLGGYETSVTGSRVI